MKAVIYVRVSSGNEEKQSYDRQIADLKRWAEFKRLDVVKVFAERISGFRKSLDDRIQFNEMNDFIKKEGIKHILISELSRLSRRSIDSINYINESTKAGVNIHIYKEQLSTLDEDGSENNTVRMLIAILSNIAQDESSTLSHRIKSGKRHSALHGGGFSSKIYGYDKGEDNKPQINEEEAVLIRKIFELTLYGIGTRAIATFLNENYDTKEWKGASVHSIIRNSFYMGKRKYQELLIDVPHIVDETTWNEAQRFVNERKRFTGKGIHVNPFKSFITCKCGATMTQVIIPQNNLNLYRCSKKCGVKSINRAFLIHEVKQIVERNAKLTKDTTVRKRMSNQIKTYSANITKNEKRIRQLKLLSDKNYERFLLGKLDEEAYESYELKFTIEIENLTKDIKEQISNRTATETALKQGISHYSDDLEVFKTQLFKQLEYIMIDEEIAFVKVKGWGKAFFPIYRGSKLQVYNNHYKKMKK